MAPGKGGGKGGGGADEAEAACASPEAFCAWAEELLLLEQREEDEQTTELLTTCNHAELQARGIAIFKLCVGEQTTALYGRTCLTLEKIGGTPLPAHRITNGDIVGVFDQSSKPLSSAAPLASAVVQRVRPNGISLVFDADVPNELLDGRQLTLAAMSSDVTMKRYRDAMDMLKSGRVDGPAGSLVACCFGGEGANKPRFHEAKSEDCGRPDAVDCAFRAEQSHKLNEPQRAAVMKALCAADIVIVHGPPGTGKTTTLVAYILEAVYRKQRLLVTAPSNVAVDNLLERIAACGCKSIVRLGHPARVQTELHKHTMDNVVYASEQASLCRDIKQDIDDALKRGGKKGKDGSWIPRVSKTELTELRKELRTRERKAVAEVLRKTQVVFATCAGAATLHREIRKDKAHKDSLEFDVVVIDEAAQALEVSCWIPLLLGKKAVLAGDHQQLSATVKSAEATRRCLDRTLFARMIERHGDDVAALLNIQYRMNATIMGWSSRSFYDNRLEAADCVASRTLELTEVPAANLTGDVIDMLKAPMLFVDTGGLAMYREDGSDEVEKKPRGGAAGHAAAHQSRANVGESRFLVHYAKMLIKCGISPKDITVITPYNRQVERLRADFMEDEEAQRLGLENPRVNTVDSFQGQEADAVLISLVRSNERSSVGFLADFRRLNVAVTRARKHVMLVGDAATISSDSMLASLYNYACESGKAVFVQQLLDEEGGVPADPSAVPEPRRAAKAQKTLDQGEKKFKDESEVRRRFEQQLQALADTGGRREFPPDLNPFERAIAHEVATSLGLLHESRGEGMQRRLVVWTAGAAPEEPEAKPAPADGEAGPSKRAEKRAKAEAAAAASSSSKPAKDAGGEDESGDEGETPLMAFERRAAALIASLGGAQPAAEWKAPSEEERGILERLARERGLELLSTGSGKKRRCRVAVEDAGAAAAASSSASPPPAAAPGPNAMLANLAAEKHRRQATEAEARRQGNEAAEAEMKQAKKTGAKKKEVSAPAVGGEEDLDAVLLEFSQKERLCAFGDCRAKVNMIISTVSECRHCQKSFCLKHQQAELHGCGDAAQRYEQKKWKATSENAMNPRGSGLVNKSVSDSGRAKLADKLQSKIAGEQSGRTVKKKEEKKK